MTYEKIGQEIGALVQVKQNAYGDSFGKSGSIIRTLYPNGVPLEKLDDALTVVRVVDKLFRIATDRDALGESPWQDIAGYAILSVKRAKDAAEPKQSPMKLAVTPGSAQKDRANLDRLTEDAMQEALTRKLVGMVSDATAPTKDRIDAARLLMDQARAPETPRCGHCQCADGTHRHHCAVWDVGHDATECQVCIDGLEG